MEMSNYGLQTNDFKKASEKNVRKSYPFVKNCFETNNFNFILKSTR